MLPVEQPFKTYAGLDGKPLDNGFVYFGLPGQDPIAHPVTVYWDAAGTLPAAQPLRTVNGYLMNAGTPANVFFDGSYSELVQDSKGRQVFYAPTSDGFSIAAIVLNLAKVAGSSLVGFIQAGAGAVFRKLQDRLRETVSVMDFGAVGDGVTDDSVAFGKAAAYAASVRTNVDVPPPAVSYLLNSDPTVPDNVNFRASPDWFTGAGRMPFHAFTAISEGVDPRIFAIKGLHYTQSETNESKRKWALVGWGYYGKSPSSAAAGTTSDMVGVDGRVVVDAFNGRGWGILGLAHMTPNAFNGSDPGVSQAYASEFDVNNNSGHDVAAFDSGPIVRGVPVVSGGTNRPAEAFYTLATRRPADNPTDGDNRFWCGWRVYRDSVYQGGYIIHVDDTNQALFARIPSTSKGLRWTYRESINFAEYQDAFSFRRVLWSQTPGYGYDIVDSNGNVLISTYDGSTAFKKPLCFSNKVLAAPITLDASQQDVFVLTAGQAAITGGITGAVNGQRITIWNLTGAPITLSRNANMRTAGGAAVTISNLACVEFHYIAPTYFQIGPTNNA